MIPNIVLRMPRVVVSMLVCWSLLNGGCQVPGRIGTGPGRVGPVVAAENVWGSIAAQLGGAKVSVTSIVRNPNSDPHSYEPTTADARLLSGAGVVIQNGAGYDGWAQKLLDANPVPGREALDVGRIVGVRPGGNPHQWYSPPAIKRVIDAITAIYIKRDAADAAYFQKQHDDFVRLLRETYFRLISTIRARYVGAPVGASESIFEPLASAAGLTLRTPSSFLRAISEGAEPTVHDRTEVVGQCNKRSISVFVFNIQNSTPDVQRIVETCKEHGVAVVPITETLPAADATFQQWQINQLNALEHALAQWKRSR